MATIPKRVSERLAKETRRFQRILKNAQDRDINESDTVLIVTDMLSSVFGFDRYTEITSEFEIRSTYCDLAVMVDETVKWLIEVKAIGLDLKDSHVNQAVNYGAQHGIQWIVLTNGVNWEIYRIKFEKPIGREKLCEFNFTELNPRKQDDLDLLFLLSREGLSKAVIEEYHEHIMNVNRFMIGAILQSDAIFTVVRRELRRASPGIQVDVEEIETIITGEVLKREVVQGEAADEAKDRVRKAAGRSLVKKSRRKKKPPETAPQTPEVVSPDNP
jgi:hypothetical protein